MAGITIELSEYVIDAIANAVVKKMQKPCSCEYYDAENRTCRRSEVPKEHDLDKIRAEIIERAKGTMNFARSEGLCMALSIVDRYRAERSEEEA